MNALNMIKYTYSVILLIFSVVIVMALIFNKQTKISQDIHPVVAFILIWAALIWLSMVEGGQASMVGLPPIPRSLYKESHPISHAICEYGHRGDNLDRYLMGRQFMVLVLVFVINNSGAPVAGSEVFGLPKIVTDIFLGWGLGMILFTCMIGQLQTQVNASHCMLDYINTHFMTFTLYVAMAIEASGLLHASYLIQIIVAQMAGKPIESNEPPRNGTENLLFWGRVLVSTVLLIAAFTYTLAALFEGKTTMWAGVPNWLSVVLFFFFMSVVGMLEGMQIAFFAVAKLSEEERNSSTWASKTCKLLFQGDGHNLPGFMIGRQLCVVSCFFFVARVTSQSVGPGETNVMNVPDEVQAFFDTGLLGAYITTIVASIAWQLVASAFPMAFLSTPITYILLSICLLLEATGLCAGAWVLAHIHKTTAGFQRDEVYVGTPEDREAKMKETGSNAPSEGVFHSDVGHLAGGAFPAVRDMIVPEEFKEDFTGDRSKILANIKGLREQLALSTTDEERMVFQRGIELEVNGLRKINAEQAGREGVSPIISKPEPTSPSGGDNV